MATSDAPYAAITWVLCVPDPVNPRRIVPYLHENRGTVWFSELPFADRFLREHPALPRGSRSKAVVGSRRLLTLASGLLKAGIRTLFYDLEYGKAAAGVDLVSVAERLEGSQDGRNPTPAVLSEGRGRAAPGPGR